MVTPRFSVNSFSVGGIAFVGAAALIGGIYLIPAVREGAAWLPLMALGFALLGIVWTVLAGRWGRLAESKRAAREGVDGTATLVEAHYTSATQSAGEHGPTTHQVMRLDWDVAAPAVPGYRVRVYRKLRVGLLPALRPGLQVPVRLLPDRPDLLAISWPSGGGMPLYGGVAAGAAAVPTRVPPPGVAVGPSGLPAEARIESILDGPGPGQATYRLTVVVAGGQPFPTTIVDRGPAQLALVGRVVPVRVGALPSDVSIIWAG